MLKKNKFIEGHMYRHPNMLDIDLLVLKVEEDNGESAALRVRYWNRFSMMTQGEAELVIISPFAYDMWKDLGK
jgi:hypothetical protein